MADLATLVKEDITRYGGLFYESIWWPRLRNFHFYQRNDYEGDKEPLWWKFKVTNWLVRCWHSIYDYIVLDFFRDWLFDRHNWDSGIIPSFQDATKKLWNNILVFLTPWYYMRASFINAFINCNDSKLLDNMRNWAYVRNRQAECAYYRLKFFGLHYKLVKTVLRDPKGEAVNGFITGFIIAVNPDKTDEEKTEEVNSIKEEKTTVCTGWVFGLKSAVRELNKIAYLTQDLKWESPTKWHEEHPNYLSEIEAEVEKNDAELKACLKIHDEEEEKKDE